MSPLESLCFRTTAATTTAARPRSNGNTLPATATGATAIGGGGGAASVTTGGGGASTTGRTQPVRAAPACAATAAPAAAAALAPAAQTAARDSEVPKTLKATRGSTGRGVAAAAELASSDRAMKAVVYLRKEFRAAMMALQTTRRKWMLTCTGMDETQVTGPRFRSDPGFFRVQWLSRRKPLNCLHLGGGGRRTRFRVGCAAADLQPSRVTSTLEPIGPIWSYP